MFEMYGRTCYLCGHDGAGEADHLIPLAIDPDQPVDPHGMRPSHGSNAPCPICGQACNQVRGIKPPTEPLRTSQDW